MVLRVPLVLTLLLLLYPILVAPKARKWGRHGWAGHKGCDGIRGSTLPRTSVVATVGTSVGPFLSSLCKAPPTRTAFGRL